MIEQETDTIEPVGSVQRQRPTPMNSLVAAAQRITKKTIERRDKRQTTLAQQWQEDAWDMYDLVGEQRFLADTLSNRLGQARLYVGKLNTDDPTAAPEPVTEGKPAEAWSFFANGSAAKISQLTSRLGVNLFVAGDGWFVGIPKDLLDRTRTDQPDPEEDLVDQETTPDHIDPIIPGDANTDMGSLEWRMLSVSEVTFGREGTVSIALGEGKNEKIVASPDDVFLIRVWRPHPRRWWQANSPTRASLPVLRELVGLTMEISAKIDSRLAGAGVLLVPQSASDAIRRKAQIEDDDDSDPFVESLIDAMTTPITDRSSAAAVVPLVLTVPDETVEKFKHISFADASSDKSADRDEAIRRLALGQDAPPEILLGVADMNHWGAWLVREDTVVTHIEPPLALICDALTSQFLHPILVDQGMSDEQAAQYVIWFDVDHLIMRPNRSSDAKELHAAGVISDEALRDATGFDEADAPKGETLDMAVSTALDMVRAAPSLAQAPGLPALVDQLRAVIEGKPAPETPPASQPPPEDQPDSEEPSGASEEGPPNTSEEPPPEDIAASSVPTVLVRDGVTRPLMIPISHGGD